MTYVMITEPLALNAFDFISAEQIDWAFEASTPTVVETNYLGIGGPPPPSKNYIHNTHEDEKLLGTSANDVFIFEAAQGTDIIEEFDHAEDQLEIVKSSFLQSFTDLTLTQDGPNVVISVANQGTIIMQDVDLDSLHEGHFSFVDTPSDTAPAVSSEAAPEKDFDLITIVTEDDADIADISTPPTETFFETDNAYDAMMLEAGGLAHMSADWAIA